MNTTVPIIMPTVRIIVPSRFDALPRLSLYRNRLGQPNFLTGVTASCSNCLPSLKPWVRLLFENRCPINHGVRIIMPHSTHTKTVIICYLQGSGGNSCTSSQYSVLLVHSTARRMCGSPIRFLLSYKTKKKIGIVDDRKSAN